MEGWILFSFFSPLHFYPFATPNKGQNSSHNVSPAELCHFISVLNVIWMLALYISFSLFDKNGKLIIIGIKPSWEGHKMHIAHWNEQGISHAIYLVNKCWRKFLYLDVVYTFLSVPGAGIKCQIDNSACCQKSDRIDSRQGETPSCKYVPSLFWTRLGWKKMLGVKDPVCGP